jgi:ParB family transcriptional regulator, chromosome partitioning protein
MSKITTKLVPLSALVTDEINVRREGNGDLAGLKAAILAYGVVQSLRVRPGSDKGTFKVPAGGRRFAALCELRDEGKISADYQVPVIIGNEDDATAREISLIENVERLPLSVLDEIKAYADLVSDKVTAGEIAARFGVPVKRVLQRLALANLHADVLDALGAGKITLEAAQAFTVQPDPERQAAYLATAQGWQLDASNVRRAMTDAHLRADSPLAKLLGEDAYVKAGGVVLEDLFRENRYWTSVDVIEALTQAHWAEKVTAWKAEGWAWVSPLSEYEGSVWSMRRLDADEPEPSKKDAKRLAKIEAEISELSEGRPDLTDEEADKLIDALEAEQRQILAKYEPAFTAEQKAISGVIYSEEGDRVWFGLLDPEKVELPEDEAAPAPVGKPKPKDAGDPLALSAALRQDLSVMLSASIRRKVEGDSDLALSLACATLYLQHNATRVPSTLKARPGAGLDRKYEEESFAAAVERYAAMTPKGRAKAFAALFAATLDVSDDFTRMDGNKEARAALIAAVDPDARKDFDAERYFGGVSKAVIFAAYAEMTGGGKLNDGKKGDLVAVASEKAVETGWLPVQLRTPCYAGPAGQPVGAAA